MTLDERKRHTRVTSREFGRDDGYGRIIVTEQEWLEIQKRDLSNHYKGAVVEVECGTCTKLFEVDNGSYTSRMRNSSTGRLQCSRQCHPAGLRHANKSTRRPRPSYWDHIKG